ncbi:hypothetical protein BRADI_1g43871v3 [Brachypodium distachyon]|uniref:Uncharacterized protein n=1 Tax=Brachypodium distachyon TaxID=15368 RepID=A0A0Q3K2V2_BRADI|nr:hypothetical protein BRADI_1g43871v3 [Brachypodium distachyon]
MGKWSVGLYDCFGDLGTCCLTCWCPCITFGRIAEIVDRGSACCNWLYSCTKRSSMQAQNNFQESRFMDCCIHFCCETCALCQEYKELENRGFNMSKGWEGNNKMVVGMAAPEKQGMDALLDHV